MRADAKKNYEHVLEVGREVVAEQGAEASMREVARRAGVGIGTLYRHFPTREALLEALLRERFDALAARAGALASLGSSGQILVAWLREMVALTHRHRGVIASMTAAIADPGSALHASCVSMRGSGTQLLARAQADGEARLDIDGADLFALVSALAWLNDQPSLAERADRLFQILADAILVKRSAGMGDSRSPALAGAAVDSVIPPAPGKII